MAVDQERIGTAGSWLKTGERLYDIAADLLVLSKEIAGGARF